MTAPRQAMFQRKGGAETGAIPTDAPDTSAASQEATTLDVAVCPNCDCAFDPASGEILSVASDEPETVDNVVEEAAEVDPSTMAMPDGMFA